MEIKRSDSVPEGRNATINVASVFENFPWTALEQSSKGASIINVINQLLSMYHPDDGLIAYERVLKTLLVLSENLDSDLQQQIISVIPLPKGVPNDKIENLIYKITELIRSSNVSSCGEVMTGSEDKRNTEEIQNILIDSSRSFELNEKFVSSAPEVFKGFPPNEISTVHSHVRNVNYMYDTLNYNVPCMKTCVDVKQNFHEQEDSLKLKWFHSPHLLCETNLYQSTSAASCQQGFVKSMDDKYFQLSIDRFNNWNQYNVTNVPHPLHQDATCLRKLYKNNVMISKQNENELTKLETTRDGETSKNETNCEILYTGNANRASKKYNNATKHRVINVEAQEFFEQELQNEQQAIQQDIYKMDVVHCEEDVINTQTLKEDDSLMDDFVPCKRLKASLQNFLNRAKQEILIESPMLPRTKVSHTVTPATKSCKFTSQKSLRNNDRLNLSNDSACAFKDATESTKKLTEKKTAPRNVYSKPQRLQVLRKSLNTIRGGRNETKEFERFAANRVYYRAGYV
ncbi:uncharacterized protein LOC108632827 isoform X2 [Ceratina calcarata]|uniref:Uncharacterized protein LOC108632827 isoform X2 n=1 Tax=Ceratina calcarata TaxID=156304 RepID=A0AAJ7RVP1_9HYME|nr:uncharacterized protein LOC108632827 isoform X2 [Ceratina calcarata]